MMFYEIAMIVIGSIFNIEVIGTLVWLLLGMLILASAIYIHCRRKGMTLEEWLNED